MSRRIRDSINILAGTSGRRIRDAWDSIAENGITLDGSESSKEVYLKSSIDGGVGYQTTDRDTTSRLTVESYQTNGPTGGTNSGFFGEGIRMDLMDDRAKNMLAWRTLRNSNNTRNAAYYGTVRSVIWAGYHWYAQDQPDINNPTVVHGHYSFAEVPDQNDALRTRFAVDVFDPADGKIGVATTNIYTNLSHTSFHAENDQVVRIFGGMSHERTLEWNILRSPTDQTTFRFGLTLDTNDNFRLRRRDSASNSKKTVMFFNRTNGRVIIGEAGTNATGDVETGVVEDAQATVSSALGTQHVMILRNLAAMNANGKSSILFKNANANDRIFTTLIAGDSLNRYVQTASGLIEWGSGSASRDTNLYRSAADILKTDDKFVATAGIGVGNSASATTSVGSLARKMEVFDAAGASLGFVPIYSSIS